MKRLVKACMSLLLMLGAIGIQRVGAEEGETTYTGDAVQDNEVIKNDETGIPDPNLYAEVLKAGDSNQDGILTYGEAKKINTIEIRNDSIDNYSFKGISKLENVYSLYFVYLGNTYSISNIDEIKDMPNLNTLSLEGCNNVTIEEIANPKLDILNLTHCSISSINGIENLQNLSSLTLIDNSISDISALQNLQELDSLRLSSNKISDISPIKSLQRLDYLELNNNNIKDVSCLDSESLQNLRTLWLEYNDINDISALGNLQKLDGLHIGYNKINDLSALGNLQNITSLDISGNQFNDISVFEIMHNLTWLKINDANINDISTLKNLENLEYLFLNDNNINDISVLENFQKLISLELAYNNIDDISALEELQNLRSLRLFHNNIYDITALGNHQYLNDLDLGDNNLKELPFLTKLENLNKNYTNFVGNKLTEEELKAKLPSHIASDQNWIDKNKYVAGSEPEESKHIEFITSDSIPTNLTDLIYDEKVLGANLSMSNSDTVNSDVFKAVQETGKEVTFNVLGEDNKSKYSWSFDGKDIKNPNMSLDLNISFETEKQQEIQSITNQSNMFYVSFKHHGELPGKAKIKVDVSDTYKDGDFIYLYYYNEDKGTIEQKGNGYLVKDGYAEFEIDHCSVYFFTKEQVKDKDNGKPVEASTDKSDNKDVIKDTGTVNTGVNENTAFITFVAVLSLIGLGFAIKAKKKSVK